MELIGKSKISKHKVGEKHTYPLVRFPETHLDLAGDTVHIYETYYKGRRMFLLAPDDGFDGEITQTSGNSAETIVQLLKNITQSSNNSDLESRVNVIEQKLETILEALKTDNGPEEIRTPDPRRVKAMS